MLVPRAADGAESIRRLLEDLPRALNGAGPALVLHAAGRRHLPAASALTQGHDDPHDPTAVAVATSGSGGRPRTVLLPASALLTSAGASHDRLGGPGRWLLALPAYHVAGVNVLVRSLVSRTSPVMLDLATGFVPEHFTAACRELTGSRRYTALVPTQLVRLLDAGGPALAALAGLDAVLVGGAATAPVLLDRARAAGVNVVTSYGMSETCGGCVYDGVPLDGVQVSIDPDGRIRLAGPVLARGYLDPQVAPGHRSGFVVDGTGQRWFVTDDAGRWTGTDGAGPPLAVQGRLDAGVTSGAVTVAVRAVEDVLSELPAVAEAVVAGIPDREWGERLVAAVVVAAGRTPPTLEQVRAHVRRRLTPAAAPRELLVLDELPTLGPGKPDRAAVAAMFLDTG